MCYPFGRNNIKFELGLMHGPFNRVMVSVRLHRSRLIEIEAIPSRIVEIANNS